MRFINKPVKETNPTPEEWMLRYRIAVCQGANGFYTVNVSTKERAAELEKNPAFVRWGTDWSFVNVR